MNGSSTPYVPWSWSSSERTHATVLPDGCRDVLIICDSERLLSVQLTDRDRQTRHVQVEGGRQMYGFRLAPGVPITENAIAALNDLAVQWGTRDPLSLAGEVQLLLAAEFGPCTELERTIDLLTAPAATVGAVARASGVSERALHRRFRAAGLYSPDFWRLLGRARRAARTLRASAPLSAHALQHGFSDQAHMTREFVRWFGVTPSQLRHDGAIRAQLHQPGLGNWTGEHSSTR